MACASPDIAVPQESMPASQVADTDIVIHILRTESIASTSLHNQENVDHQGKIVVNPSYWSWQGNIHDGMFVRTCLSSA